MLYVQLFWRAKHLGFTKQEGTTAKHKAVVLRVRPLVRLTGCSWMQLPLLGMLCSRPPTLRLALQAQDRALA